MKRMKILAVLLFSMISIQAYAQDAKALFRAIGNADAQAFASVFTNDVEICIGVDQDFYSKSQAVKKLDNFLKQVSPRSSKHLHEGQSKDNKSRYSVGTLQSNNGKFRVFIYYEGNKVAGLMFNPE